MATGKQILEELRDIRSAIAALAGTSDLPEAERFSLKALEKAAQEFRKLKVKRGNGCPIT